MKKHKVAIVYHYWASYREPIVRLLCQERPPNSEYCIFSGLKTDRVIATIDPLKAKMSIKNGGLRWRILSNFWFFRVFLWQSGMIKLALSKEFDTIIYLGQMYFLSTWVSICLARLTGKRVLMWTHGFISEEKNLKGFIRTCFYKLAHGLLLYGKRAKNILIKKGFDSNKLYIVYNSLDYDLQEKLRKTNKKGYCKKLRKTFFKHSKLPILLFIGRLTPQKKLKLLVEAAGLLHERSLRVNILFIGDGPESKVLQDFVDAKNLRDYVTFYGACYEEKDLAPLIMMADICVSPGEVGLTAIHSLTYGTPVITHNEASRQMPEYESIIPFETGAFFNYGSAESLADVIEHWLSSNNSKKDIAYQCINIIDKYYNPHVQLKIFNAAVKGIPAKRI